MADQIEFYLTPPSTKRNLRDAHRPGYSESYNKAYYQRNKQKIAADGAIYRAAHREELREEAKRYRSKQGESLLRKERVRNRKREKDPAYIQKRREYAITNRERFRARRQKYYLATRHKFLSRFLLLAARKRAKRDRLPFNLEISDIHVPELCPVFGIPLMRGNGKMALSSPTLDRLRPSVGYVKGNVRVISARANQLKSNATLEELKILVSWYEKELNNTP